MRLEPTFGKPELHEKKWGTEYWIVNNDKFCGKILRFDKGQKFSAHYHIDKQESFYILKGKVKFNWFNLENADRKTKTLMENDVVHIPRNCPHQIEAIVDSTIIEISTHHEDSDSYRIEKGASQTA